jgi:hypothetical protein
LQAGKFRKECQTFDIKAAVDEIYFIGKFKADYNGINVKMEFENFANNFLVHTDQRRLQ